MFLWIIGANTPEKLTIFKVPWGAKSFLLERARDIPPGPVFSRDAGSRVAWFFVFKRNCYGDAALGAGGGRDRVIGRENAPRFRAMLSSRPGSPAGSQRGAPGLRPPTRPGASAPAGAPGPTLSSNSVGRTRVPLVAPENRCKRLRVKGSCWVPILRPGRDCQALPSGAPCAPDAPRQVWAPLPKGACDPAWGRHEAEQRCWEVCWGTSALSQGVEIGIKLRNQNYGAVIYF